MYVSLPFPKCPKCNKASKQGYHHNCGGSLEIDPESKMVHCPECGRTWNIWESNYYCSCGNRFSSDDVAESVYEMLMLCKVCMIEIQKQQRAEESRKKLCENSIRSVINEIFNKIGYVVGVAVESVIQTIMKWLFN